MTTTNGQAPFLSVCMYLGETDEYKEELAMIIEEMLRQRIVGMKMIKEFTLHLHFLNFFMFLKKIIFTKTLNIII